MPAADARPSTADAWRKALALAAVVVALDQITKEIARSELIGDSVSLGLGFELVFVTNRGIAFGLLGNGESLVIVVTLAALALLLGWFVSDPLRPGAWLAVGLLLGGALGNLADRVRADAVTDFIDPPFWPAFNLADVAITAGVATLALAYVRRE